MASYVGQAAIKVNLRPQLELSHTVFLDLYIFSRVMAQKTFLFFSRTKRLGIYHLDVP